jgi:hypothetical protein
MKDGSKLTRQHSIELYERENQTFRGYSFLIDGQNNCGGIHPILSMPIQDGFTLEDSKD